MNQEQLTRQFQSIPQQQMNQNMQNQKPKTPLAKYSSSYQQQQQQYQNKRNNSDQKLNQGDITCLNQIMTKKLQFQGVPQLFENNILQSSNKFDDINKSSTPQSQYQSNQMNYSKNYEQDQNKNNNINLKQSKSYNHTPGQSIGGGQSQQFGNINNNNCQIDKLREELIQAKGKNKSRSKSANKNLSIGNSNCVQIANNMLKNNQNQNISSVINADMFQNFNNLEQNKLQGKKVRLSAQVPVSNINTNQLEVQQELKPYNNLSRSPSNIIFNQIMQNQEKSNNIRVFARFRPFNKTENQLTENGLGNECCIFPDKKTVVLEPDNQVFTMDTVFDQNSTQEEIYQQIGEPTIQDILNGYNGTIFAYGQTGSGKTHSMYGQLHDVKQQGIIPRAIQQIFKHIENSDYEIEWVLSCSMLEIYKENLHDLLSINKTDLKIKESPVRGIYVEGLNNINVSSYRELLDVLDLGEQARKVAATRINQYSSRSHTIFMLEIKQRFSNDTEKKGKLNLVDLAGSEKVHKTGAMGEILEEAKKINLSLSCLGNVIHSLTNNTDHIPYRDSKLTRILQESLGGNFKTSLLVTCSSHSTSLEESISTLKFATRAKSIQNHFKMNIKNSPEALQRIIYQLKKELILAREQIEQYKQQFGNLSTNATGGVGERLITEFVIPNEDKIQNIPSNYDSSVLSMNKSSFKNKFQSRNISISETQSYQNNLEDQITGSELTGQLSDIELFQKTEYLQLKVQQQDKEIQNLNYQLQEQNNTIKELQAKEFQMRNESSQYQNEIGQLKDENSMLKMNLEKQQFYNEPFDDKFRNQIDSIRKALEIADKKSKQYIKEKSDIANKNFVDMSINQLQDKINLPDFMINLGNCNANTSQQGQILQMKKRNYPFIDELRNTSCQNKIMYERLSFLIKLLDEAKDNKEFIGQQQLAVTLMKHELLRSMTLNQNMDTNLTALEISTSLDYQKSKIKKNITKTQGKHIENLENVLVKARTVHQLLRNRCDRAEEDAVHFMQQEQLLTQQNNNSNNNTPDKKYRNNKIVKPFHNQKFQNDLIEINQQDENIIKKLGEQQFIKVVQDLMLKELDILFCSFKEARNDRMVQHVNQNGLTIAKELQNRLQNIVCKLTQSMLEDKIKKQQQSEVTEEILKMENTRMQNKILILCQELDLEISKSEKLQMALTETTKNLQSYKLVLRDFENKTENQLQKEINKFNQLRIQVDNTVHQEILKKLSNIDQKDIKKMQQYQQQQLLCCQMQNNRQDQQLQNGFQQNQQINSDRNYINKENISNFYNTNNIQNKSSNFSNTQTISNNSQQMSNTTINNNNSDTYKLQRNNSLNKNNQMSNQLLPSSHNNINKNNQQINNNNSNSNGNINRSSSIQNLHQNNYKQQNQQNSNQIQNSSNTSNNSKSQTRKPSYSVISKNNAQNIQLQVHLNPNYKNSNSKNQKIKNKDNNQNINNNIKEEQNNNNNYQLQQQQNNNNAINKLNDIKTIKNSRTNSNHFYFNSSENQSQVSQQSQQYITNDIQNSNSNNQETNNNIEYNYTYNNNSKKGSYTQQQQFQYEQQQQQQLQQDNSHLINSSEKKSKKNSGSKKIDYFSQNFGGKKEEITKNNEQSPISINHFMQQQVNNNNNFNNDKNVRYTQNQSTTPKTNQQQSSQSFSNLAGTRFKKY